MQVHHIADDDQGWRARVLTFHYGRHGRQRAGNHPLLRRAGPLDQGNRRVGRSTMALQLLADGAEAVQ